ncbi:MAG: hypothetical protein ACPGJV_02610 [Bacteriovoracaceae bacterium]
MLALSPQDVDRIQNSNKTKAIREENERLRKALEFYANKENWQNEPALSPDKFFHTCSAEDEEAIGKKSYGGAVARKALAND